MPQATLFDWLRNNVSSIITISTLLVGFIVTQVNLITRVDSLEKFQSSHILFHGERGKEVEGKLSSMEQKISPMENIQYRLSRAEAAQEQFSQSVSKQMEAIAAKVDRMSTVFVEASLKMGDRLTRIETLLERQTDVYNKRQSSGSR